MSDRSKLLSRVCLAALTMAVAACGGGGDRVEVRGTVTFEGVPLESGSIAFAPIEGTPGPSTGGSIRNGKYHLDPREAPVVGRHRVMIQATRSTGRQVEAGEGDVDPTKMVDEVEMFIPAEYNRNSKLTVDVQAGSNEFPFHLGADGAEVAVDDATDEADDEADDAADEGAGDADDAGDA